MAKKFLLELQDQRSNVDVRVDGNRTFGLASNEASTQGVNLVAVATRVPGDSEEGSRGQLTSSEFSGSQYVRLESASLGTSLSVSGAGSIGQEKERSPIPLLNHKKGEDRSISPTAGHWSPIEDDRQRQGATKAAGVMPAAEAASLKITSSPRGRSQ